MWVYEHKQLQGAHVSCVGVTKGQAQARKIRLRDMRRVTTHAGVRLCVPLASSYTQSILYLHLIMVVISLQFRYITGARSWFAVRSCVHIPHSRKWGTFNTSYNL